MEDSVKKLLISMLNSSFSASSERNRKRKIIFWYDAAKEFQKSIDELELENTEIIKYDNNSFWIRYHIEKEELNKNIIIYLPIERKKGANNELLDIETANSDLLFNPDRSTMKVKDLGLNDDCRQVIKKYIRFFNNTMRQEAFNEFDIEEKNCYNIDYIITSVLLNIKTINIDDIIKNIIKVYYDDKKKYENLFKYGNEEFILSIINDYFGSNIQSQDELDTIFKSLIFTYFVASISDKNQVNRYGKYVLSNKITNSQVFVNNLMRDKTTKKYFELISNELIHEFGIDELLNTMLLEDYIQSDCFYIIDKKIILYLVQQLLNEINEFDRYSSLITSRESKYWYDKYYNEYNFLKIVNNFLKDAPKIQELIKAMSIEDFIKLYSEKLYFIDTLYRKMYYYFDMIDDKDDFIDLKNKIENIYINTYMMELFLKWSEVLQNLNKYDETKLLMQNKFYNHYIKANTEGNKVTRTIVIISDAFRFECAKELNEKLKTFGAKSEIEYMQGLIPSYTKLGIASLLPNSSLKKANDEINILVDNNNSSGLEDRIKILQYTVPESIAYYYDDLINKNKSDWKKDFTGKKVIYIYHNTIDKAGEHDEINVFDASEKAINQIYKLIKDLHTTFSGINCFITADHGYFYKRGSNQAYNKVNKLEDASIQKDRFSYTDSKSNQEGILSINTDYIFGKNSGYVNIPKGDSVFSKSGNSSTYIHGGILPQEIIIPVIDFKSTRNISESQKVGITYSGLTTRITNAITYLEFLQDNNVDENNLECRYLVHFEDQDSNKVSSEATIVANYKNTEVKDRFFKEKFVFKNIDYDKEKNYYLVITDEETGIEKDRMKFIIDITIINNFGF